MPFAAKRGQFEPDSAAVPGPTEGWGMPAPIAPVDPSAIVTPVQTPVAPPIVVPEPTLVTAKPNPLMVLGAFLASPSGHRLAVFLLGFLVVTLNKRVGLNLDTNDLVATITMCLGFIVPSAAKEASDNHAEAKVEAASIFTAVKS